MEEITVDGVVVPHEVVSIRGDGACLFSSLSYVLYGTDTQSNHVRLSIVQHISNNWRRFKPYTMKPSGDPYRTKPEYLADMSKNDTYGTTCEVIAAAEIFPYKFEVYHNGVLLARYGEPGGVVKRLRFSGDLMNGHFDVLIPINAMSLPNPQQSSVISTYVPPEMDKSKITRQSSPSSDESVSSTITVSSTKGKKRRKRFTDAIRRKKVRVSIEKYENSNPGNLRKINRDAVKKYQKSHPEVNRGAVEKYRKSHPEVNRGAVEKYQKSHPEVHRKSTRKYHENNPAVNQAATAKYNKKRIQVKLLPWSDKSMSGFKYESQIDYSKDKAVQIGSRSPCIWCQALKWKDESPGMCCGNGKVQLPALAPYPEPLYSLLTHQHPLSEHFLTSIRKYNGCFQMTSFGAKKIREGNFMPTFKVQGQVYHRIGSLIPEQNKQPSFLQIYFVGDENNEKNIRCGIYSGLKPELVGQLQIMLHEHNKYILEFTAAVDHVPKDQKDFQVVINADRKPSGEHQGRFNVPTCREMAVLIVGQAFEKRDIVIHSRGDKVVRISETHRAYDTLQYPLMFCYGQDGYYICISQCDPKTKVPLRKTVSAADFYSYRIMEHDGEECCLLLFRQLLNQFLVDMYAKIETERLNWIRSNQKKLRSEEYVHLKDAMARKDCELSELGKMIVLPSSFTGGPRYMHERTQDAMTYVRHFGRPDLFITFTCNPKWPEIVEHLKEGQQAHDRHDIVTRIFHIKVKHLMKLLTKACIFGPTKCHMYSVEWQKRGLPHIHILLWLENKMKPESIDNVIVAEIPDPDTDPVLHEIVKTTMIHGPCGPLNKKSPCMSNGKCTKKYPRPLLKETQTGEDGYPQYRRRSCTDGGFVVNIKGVDLDNRWVVPYNPTLSRTFSAHINVEFCNSVKSIKYICKYVNKGSDQAVFTVEDLDEVARYEAGRYISSSEAAWRILCFPIHERYPPVMQLAVHLENGQRVYFNKNNIIDKILNPQQTTLLGFFELCKRDGFARTLKYNEVPAYYVWKGNKFCRRKQGKGVSGYPGIKKDQTLGRVYTVHPANSECYHLRLLLHQVCGPTSFAALKTVNGVVHPTFQMACRSLGLLEDDAHWDHTLEEAAISDTPTKIRELFAVMLVFCQVGDPMQLWEKHQYSLAEDIKCQMELKFGEVQLSTIYNSCLILLEDIVSSMSGKALSVFGLPTPLRDQEAVVVNRRHFSELSYDTIKLSEAVALNIPKLNEDQRDTYNKIMCSIDSDYGKLFFLDAPGGTGKTFLINLLLSTIRSKKKIAVAVASSGIAATLIDGGKTAHSAFKLPFSYSETSMCNISKQSDMAQVLQEAKLIVWDECTMAHKGGFEALDRTLRDIRDKNRLMGGVTTLLAGDFRQTLPVVPRGTRADEVKACLKSSFLWPKVKVLSLKVNMRVHLKHDLRAEEFAQLLLSIGDGKLLEEEGRINISGDLCHVVGDLVSLTDKIYPNIEKAGMECASWLRERAILTPTNESVTSINNFLLEKLPSAVMRYESVDSVIEVEDTVHYPVEFLHTLNPPSIPPHILSLKVGVPIMLLRNLNPPKLCNGTRLQVISLQKHVIEAKIITGANQGETVFIPRIPLIPTDYHFQFKRLQFPVKVCYAMTINKAQGQSLKLAGVDLRTDCFSHGQLYVACSRVSSPDSLIILQPDGRTRNVVYKEILSN